MDYILAVAMVQFCFAAKLEPFPLPLGALRYTRKSTSNSGDISGVSVSKYRIRSLRRPGVRQVQALFGKELVCAQFGLWVFGSRTVRTTLGRSSPNDIHIDYKLQVNRLFTWS